MAAALKDTFEMIEGDFEDKAISLITVVNNMKANTDSIDAEVKRLQERKKIIVNRQESLKTYLRINMEATGIKKIDCPLFTITLRAGVPIVLVKDEGLVPTDYMKITTSMAPMKKEILAALKEGVDVPGCELGAGKATVLIK